MSNALAQDALNKWSGLIEQALSDETLKRRLIEHPAVVLAEHGLEVRPGLEVRVVENTDKVAYLTLPPAPAQGELTMDEMDRVAGGFPAEAVSLNFGTIAWVYTPQKHGGT